MLILAFLRTRPLLSVSRSGKAISARVVEATTYARSGRAQDGIDVQAMMDNGENWVFQCKRVKTWNRSQTQKAIGKATFAAAHYFLVLACNPPGDVHEEMAQHSNWTLWNLDTTCNEIRARTPPEALPRILSFLSPEELKRFTPFTTTAFVTPEQFFADRIGAQRLFRHDWNLVGRVDELKRLAALMKPDGPRGTVIYSKGGDGKSRLLLEFSRVAASAGTPVLFLNRNGSSDGLDFALLRDEPNFIIIVDDAHRPDPRHLPLLQLAEQEKRARLLFATRPQGFHPLLSRLIETGLREEFDEFPLPLLRAAEIRGLAEQALGSAQHELVEALTQLTKDSAFLTVLAGELIRLGRLQPGEWASEEDFRLRVFKAFEEENLRELPFDVGRLAARLLRVIALLAPVNLDESFSERSASAIGANTLDVEDQIGRLRSIQLLTESRDESRIIPDLFADFLAYDVAVDGQRKQSALVHAVRREFPDATSTMLRNLAEASWVGGPPTRDVDMMLAPLVEAEFRRFRALDFPRRAAFLEAWGGYGVYIPSQTVELAKIALAETQAPLHEPDFQEIFPVPEPMNCHGYVLEKIAGLVAPVALYHEQHRDAALDILWEVGKRKRLKRFLNLGPHAWETIGSVVKPQAGKPVDVCLAGLDWLARKLADPAENALVSANLDLLPVLLSGCFTRFVEFHRRRGMTMSSWEQPVHQANTVPIRQQALTILSWLIERSDARTAAGVLRVLDHVMRRVVQRQRWVEDVDAFRSEWREERLAGLNLLRAIIGKHPEPFIRYLARTQLLGIIQYEEDIEFREACRATIAIIPDDLDLRMSRALLADAGLGEDDDDMLKGAVGTAQTRERWAVKREGFFEEFRAAHREPIATIAALSSLHAQLCAVDCHPAPWRFFTYLSQHNPNAALAIAVHLVEETPESPLANAWPSLINSAARGTAPIVALERRALTQQGTNAAAAALQSLIGRHKQEPALTNEQQTLVLETAARANENETQFLLRVLATRDPHDPALVREIIARLPPTTSPEIEADSVMRILTSHCAQGGADAAFVRKLLGRLHKLLEFDLSQDPDAWHLLTTQYPRELLDFFRVRVELESSPAAPAGFRALNTFRPVWLDLAKLQTSPDFESLREDVWRHALAIDKSTFLWLQLFQHFGLSDVDWLESRLLSQVDAATSAERLRFLTKFISFRGSLIAMRRPALTRRFLTRAHELGCYDQTRADLYCATGPQTTGWTDGKMNIADDYVEAEALKAAADHANDPELHLFFRWVAENEQSSKRRARTEHDLRMRHLEEE